MDKIIECVPNFSEGRDLVKVEKIADCFRTKQDVKLLNYSSDKDHNRMVITAIGEPQALKKAVIESIGKAIELIDLNQHTGQHPRMGAADVVPFIPIRNVTMDEAITLAKEVAKEVSDKFNLPVYLYEKAASSILRENLATVRKGGFEGLSEKLKQPEWKPDFGPSKPHPTAGASIIGARTFLIAYNINLNTDKIEIANNIAKKIRYIGGGLRYCKAMGVELKERNIVQVSMNLTDYTKTFIYQVFELVKVEAKRYGVTIAGSELIGLSPMNALLDVAEYYLGLENFSAKQIIETHLIE